MSFDAAANRVPTQVRGVLCSILVTEGSPNNNYNATYEFDILDANGDPMETRNGDLAAALDVSERLALIAVFDNVLAKAKAVIP